MGIVLRPRHILQLSYGDDATLYAVGSTLDHLRTVILEAHLVFVEFNTVRYDGLYGRTGEQLRRAQMLRGVAATLSWATDPFGR